MNRFLIALIFIILPISVHAEDTEIFSVQIGTYKQFSEEAKKSALKYGEVHVFTFKNLSRVTVGEFTSREAATTLLHKLQAAGFKDAFVRRTGYTDLSQAKTTVEKFNILISEMDAQAFYLDGYMYLYQGNGYIKIFR